MGKEVVVPLFSVEQDSASDFWWMMEVLSASSILIARHKTSMHQVTDNMWDRLANCFAKKESWRFFLPEISAGSWRSFLPAVGLVLALRCAARLVAAPGWPCWVPSSIFPCSRGFPALWAIWILPSQGWFYHPWAASAQMRRAKGRIVLREHPRANFAPSAASKGSKSEEQLEKWEMTVSVSVGLISETWNLPNDQPECMCY